MTKNVLLMLAATLVANLLGKYIFDFCELNHIDLVKPIFVGLFVTCVVAVSSQKTVLPAALGVGSAIGEIISQVIPLFHFGSTK